jgi:hypothetical protein
MCSKSINPLFLYSSLFFISALQTFSATRQKGLSGDKAATKETVNLYNNLKELSQKGFMFGHQDDLAYGAGWKYQDGRSDIKDITGDYPAIIGWELGHLEIDKPVNLDSVPFNRMQQFIKDTYKRGGATTISWHLNNPLTGKSAWEPANGAVTSVLPGGSKHDLFKTWQDKVAEFMNGLKGSQNEFIPVIFRPFHELKGSWFWWGGRHCTPEEFKKLWIFTVSYLRNEKKIHHLLYAYNTDRFFSKEEFLLKYPGNEWVDVIGFDTYAFQQNKNIEKVNQETDQMLSALESIAAEKNKISALTEFGGVLSDSAWWTGTFHKRISKHKIAYVLGWRNAGAKLHGELEAYVPYKGCKNENDFVKFYKLKNTFFGNDVAAMKLYKPGK